MVSRGPRSKIEQCACGLSYLRGHPDDEASHAKIHDAYARGPAIPALADLPADIVAGCRTVWIDSSVPYPVRRAAADVAYVECRELNRPVCYDGGETDERPRLLIALDGDRAMAMLMIADSDVHWRLRWRPEGVDPVVLERISESHLGIGRVWIAANLRGRGLASSMIAYAAERLGVATHDFVWTIPLTAGGEGLVRALCPDVWLADGSWDDLFKIVGEQPA